MNAVLEQRFSALVTVRTTLQPQGLIIQVNKFFRQRVHAVEFDRLVLEPTTLTSVRKPLLWGAAACFAAAVVLALPAPAAWVPSLVPVLIFGLAVMLVFSATITPRRLSMFLDREQVFHPVFLREGPDDAAVEGFLHEVRRAVIAWRCRPAETEAEAPERPQLADALDALATMRSEGLLTSEEFSRFRELAAQR
ncbi:MAG: hypothetical protein ACT4PU_06020 [Planctomycetota bacterium]